MQRDVRDAHRKGNTTLVILQPGTFPPKRVTPGFPFGGIVGRLTPGTLSLPRREPLDSALYRLAPLEHDQMTGDSYVRLLRPGDGGCDFLKTGALEYEIAVPSDDECRHFQLGELLPSIPSGHILKIKLLEHVRWSEEPLTCKRLDESQQPVRQTQSQLQHRLKFEFPRG